MPDTADSQKPKPEEKPKPEDLGAGTYKVNKGKTLLYRGHEYGEGELVEMSEAGAGAHFRVVTKATEAEGAAAAKAKAEAEAKAAKAAADAEARKHPGHR